MSSRSWNTHVLKLGGSVLDDLPSYRAWAWTIRARLRSDPGVRLVVVVSARRGETDALLALATSIAPEPDPQTLDLLWSAGEIRSAATLALCLQAVGVAAAARDVQQTGIRSVGGLEVDPAPIQAALARWEVVVVPGFLGAGADGGVVTLGRGGSDLTAVALAGALGAARCELLKDVPGYFTADPHVDRQAEHLGAIDYERALEMARGGCDLVQPAALELAKRAGLTLVIAAAGDARHTAIRPQSAGCSVAVGTI